MPTSIEGAVGVDKIAESARNQTLGFDQTWQDVSASRAIGTPYTNSTGKPIAVSVGLSGSITQYIDVDGVQVGYIGAAAGVDVSIFAIIPPGSIYTVIGVGSVISWAELR